MKNILVIDDSALMRRVLSDTVNSDDQLNVTGIAKDGLEALELLKTNTYDCILLDINMPNMNGIEFLEFLKRTRKKEKVLVVSTDTVEGADVTIRALELGAIDFIKKPNTAYEVNKAKYRAELINRIHAIVDGEDKRLSEETKASTDLKSITRFNGKVIRNGRKIVVIASSTGGPAVLRQVIPGISEKINAPIVIVQHMPKGFTKSFADRLDNISSIPVQEAEENYIDVGKVYVAQGGRHLKYKQHGNMGMFVYSDEPTREGVRPSANYMYESLIDSDFEEIICLVLTGMGQDGYEGIRQLSEKKKCKILIQSPKTCTVYGMPRAIERAGLADEILDIDKIAARINELVGLR